MCWHAGSQFYGPEGMYPFAGHECARALARMSMEEIDCSADLDVRFLPPFLPLDTCPYSNPGYWCARALAKMSMEEADCSADLHVRIFVIIQPYTLTSTKDTLSMLIAYLAPTGHMDAMVRS